MVGRSRKALRRVFSVLVVALGTLLVRVPYDARLAERLPARPARLAHLLADYSHRHESGTWMLLDEASNYTTWRYSITYECGNRCSGRAHVEAHDEPAGEAPAHGEASHAHTVLVRDTRCMRPPLLPTPQLCEHSEWWVRVSAVGVESLVSARGTRWCALWRLVTGACPRELHAQLAGDIRRLRKALLQD